MMTKYHKLMLTFTHDVWYNLQLSTHHPGTTEIDCSPHAAVEAQTLSPGPYQMDVRKTPSVNTSQTHNSTLAKVRWLSYRLHRVMTQE